MIEPLIQDGSKLEACPAQKFAIEKKEMLSYCITSSGHGKTLPPADELEKSAIHIISEFDIDMLGVLVSFDCLYKVFRVNWGKYVKGETLLQIACTPI